MLGKFPSLFWKIMWMGVAPFLLVSIVIASLYGLISETIGYEAWNSQEVSNFICFVSCIMPLLMNSY